MHELFKSKLGMLVAGIYLLMVLFCLFYVKLIDSNSPPLLLLMILIAPWFYLFTILSILLGINIPRETLGSKNVDYRIIFDNVLMAVSILFNVFILYFLGYLGTKVYRSLSSGTK